MKKNDTILKIHILMLYLKLINSFPKNEFKAETKQIQIHGIQYMHLNQNQNIKLLQIPLPNFDGNYEQWLFYKDTFISLIHENQSIPAIQKFHYLRLSLKGGAADPLKPLEYSEENYNIAWNLLID